MPFATQEGGGEEVPLSPATLTFWRKGFLVGTVPDLDVSVIQVHSDYHSLPLRNGFGNENGHWALLGLRAKKGVA